MNFELPLVMLLHDLVFVSGLFFVRLMLFDFFILFCVLWEGCILLGAHEKILLLDHLLVLIDLLLEELNLLSQVFLLHLHGFDMITWSLFHDEILKAFIILATLTLLHNVREPATSIFCSLIINLEGVIWLVGYEIIWQKQRILCV